MRTTSGGSVAFFPDNEVRLEEAAAMGRANQEMVDFLRDTDVHICVPHDHPARILEVHQLVLHCVCDGVDAQLLGLPEESLPDPENLT